MTGGRGTTFVHDVMTGQDDDEMYVPPYALRLLMSYAVCMY